MPSILRPDLVYRDGAFHRDVEVMLGDEGRIAAVGPNGSLSSDGVEIQRLPRRALLPGFTNAHSHAFQRLLRGRTEWRTAAADDFWTWRDRMYAVVRALTPDTLEDVCAFTFLEMVRAGITTVGEFHYLHRDPAGRSYADPNELSLRVVRAAERVGLRLVLLDVAYARGGPGQPLGEAQRRFGTPTLEQFVANLEALETSVRQRPLLTVGLAPHSVRALTREQLSELAQAAATRGWPVHMHLAEQQREVEECVAETGLRPVELSAETGLLSERFCGIHAIELRPNEIQLLGQARASVCACPTTERDLGDGVIPAAALQRAGVNLALGSDSQIQIDLLEEARSIELNPRLQAHQRILLEAGAENPHALARTLFDVASRGGALALGLPTPEIVAGAPADLIAIDLDDPSLRGVGEALLSTLIFGGQTRAITDVWVAGRLLVRDRRHPQEEALGQRFEEIASGVR